MYHELLIRNQDMIGRNCIRVPIIGIELATDPPTPGGN